MVLKDIIKSLRSETGIPSGINSTPGKKNYGNIIFTVNNVGITSQKIAISLTGSDMKIINVNTGTILPNGINTEINTSGLGDVVEILVTGNINTCEYKIPNVKKIHVKDMENLFDLRLSESMYMQQAFTLTTFILMGKNKINDMYKMFYNCINLQEVEIDAYKVSDTNYMFYGCRALNFAPVFDTSSVKTMDYMFAGCIGLNTIPQMDTNNIISMRAMFRDCTNIKVIPQMNTDNVRDMRYMFMNCNLLMDLPEMNVLNVSNFTDIFKNATSVKNIRLKNLCSNIDLSGQKNLNYESICFMLDNAKSVVNQNINITGCDGLDSLCINDPSVVNAINKGWNIIPMPTSLSIIQGATPPLMVSPKWKQMRADGSITVVDDHFLIRNNGANDWNKWYYELPGNIKKIKVSCKIKADEVTTSPNTGLWISLSNIYDSTFQVYNNQLQTGWIEVAKEFTITTPYVGFLQRGSQYVVEQVVAFDIKDLVVEKIE